MSGGSAQASTTAKSDGEKHVCAILNIMFRTSLTVEFGDKWHRDDVPPHQRQELFNNITTVSGAIFLEFQLCKQDSSKIKRFAELEREKSHQKILCFHGTSPVCAKSICDNGPDPTKCEFDRYGKGHYTVLGTLGHHALGYSGGRCKPGESPESIDLDTHISAVVVYFAVVPKNIKKIPVGKPLQANDDILRDDDGLCLCFGSKGIENLLTIGVLLFKWSSEPPSDTALLHSAFPPPVWTQLTSKYANLPALQKTLRRHARKRKTP